MFRIVIVENEETTRVGLQAFLSAQPDFSVAALGCDGYDALKLSEELKPDVLIAGVDLPLLSGPKVTPSIKLRSPETAVILTGELKGEQTLLDVVGSGAAGFIHKKSIYEEVIGAVRQVKGEGNYYLSRDITSNAIALLSRFVQEKNGNPALELAQNEPVLPLSVSKVEMRVARLIGEGLSNREIAETLNLKEGTIRNYVSFIMQKTGLKHRTQIAIYAFNNGFADRIDVVKREKRDARHLSPVTAKYRACAPAAQAK